MEFFVSDLSNPELSDEQRKLIEASYRYFINDFDDERQYNVLDLRYSSLHKDGSLSMTIYHSMWIERIGASCYDFHERDQHVMLSKVLIKDNKIANLYINDVTFNNLEPESLYEEFMTGLSWEQKIEKNILYGRKYLARKEIAVTEALEILKNIKESNLTLIKK